MYLIIICVFRKLKIIEKCGRAKVAERVAFYLTFIYPFKVIVNMVEGMTLNFLSLVQFSAKKTKTNNMEPYTVQAEYSFQRQNNDELQFKKGDIITVTQCEDGGWWEGTLGDMTGWFPSNYVKEYKGS